MLIAAFVSDGIMKKMREKIRDFFAKSWMVNVAWMMFSDVTSLIGPVKRNHKQEWKNFKKFENMSLQGNVCKSSIIRYMETRKWKR